MHGEVACTGALLDECAMRDTACAGGRRSRLSRATVLKLFAAAAALSVDTCLASGIRTAPVRRGSGDVAQSRLDQPRDPSRISSPTSSPLGSPAGSMQDVRQSGRLLPGQGSLRQAVDAVQRQRGCGHLRRCETAPGLRRATSYRTDLAGLSSAYAEGHEEFLALSVPSVPRARREDHEYRAPGDPNNKIYTRLKVGLYRDLTLS
jgi:hypothetical protein